MHTKYDQQLAFEIPYLDDSVLPVAGHNEAIDGNTKAQDLVAVFL